MERDRSPFEPPETALITGASAGIGRALAHRFAADGCRLILVARGTQGLEALARELEEAYGTESIVWPADLTSPRARRDLSRDLDARDVTVDVVVNNAGFGRHGEVARTDPALQLDMVELNVAALTELTLLFLPGMLARGRGGILNVASTAAFQPGPKLAVYYATKAYVLSFTEALAEELRGTGVTASCLAPGPTRTGFHRKAEMQQAPLLRAGTMDPDRVARVGYAGFRRGRVVVIPGVLNKFLAIAVRLTPRILVRRIVAFLHRRG